VLCNQFGLFLSFYFGFVTVVVMAAQLYNKDLFMAKERNCIESLHFIYFFALHLLVLALAPHHPFSLFTPSFADFN
jgi:hypothetical protein